MTETIAEVAIETELDQELLEEAQRHLNGATPEEALSAAVRGYLPKEKLDAALRHFVEDWRERRGRAFDRLQDLADEGVFDFSAIDEVDE
ncbi:hypothetical protein ACQP00_42130 [Dactylosporangium sp. CS-047395]|uniref:hypothetical protein n=1 Tax=Dactylosporangium sp. CS-047395 TaxID=3239936 RepID=UPI003D8BF6AF